MSSDEETEERSGIGQEGDDLYDKASSDASSNPYSDAAIKTMGYGPSALTYNMRRQMNETMLAGLAIVADANLTIRAKKQLHKMGFKLGHIERPELVAIKTKLNHPLYSISHTQALNGTTEFIDSITTSITRETDGRVVIYTSLHQITFAVKEAFFGGGTLVALEHIGKRIEDNADFTPDPEEEQKAREQFPPKRQRTETTRTKPTIFGYPGEE